MRYQNIRNIALGLAPICVLLIALGYAARGPLFGAHAGAAPASQSEARQSRTVTVGSYQIALTCVGSGSPTVVLDGYLPGSPTAWVSVAPGVAATTRVCTYERTDGAFRKLTSGQMADDLHTALGAAGIAPPYVLAATDFGGYNVRLFASRYPGEVAGLVLVDTYHEEFFARSRPFAAQLRRERQGEMTEFERLLSGELRDVVDMEGSAGQARAARRALRQLPLVVIARGKPDWPNLLPEQAIADLQRIWQEQQADLATLSTNSLLLSAPLSGHNVPQDQPQLVIDAIISVVEAARSGAPLGQ